MKLGGTEVLKNFQRIAAIFNHDYFHHFTARIIGPYFLYNGIDFDATPYKRLMGQDNIQQGTAPVKDEDGAVRFNQISAVGVEQYKRFEEESYNDEKTWHKFSKSSGANYEYHALHLHNVLYQRYMDHGPAGKRMRQHVADYFKAVKTLGDTLSAAGEPQSKIDNIKTYYANLMAFHLRRLVPHTHHLMRQAEYHIDNLGITPEYTKELMERQVRDLVRDAHGKRLHSVTAQTDVSPIDPNITAGRAARWQGCLAAVNILNLLHNEEYVAAREDALPALRQSISVIQRDLKTVEYRGGMDAARLYQAREKGNRKIEPPPRAGATEEKLKPEDPGLSL
jgi:hypothetical protein